jgi:hypothetical protein
MRKATKFRKVDSNLPELKEGQSYFCIRYTGFHVGFRTVIAAKDADEARAIFKSQYSIHADIVSVRKGTY